MRIHARLIVFLLAVTAIAALAADFNAKPEYPFHFVMYGDIRFTDPSNTRASDPVRRELLVKEIAQDKPVFVVINGDLVLRGGDANDWKEWDAGSQPFRDAGIRLFPVIGNHELVNNQSANNYLSRFPELNGKRWYSVQYGNCALFVLDSAVDEEGGAEWKWFDDALHHLPKQTRFVFIALHHPAITQSSKKLIGGGHTARPQEQALAGLIEAAHARTALPMFVVAGHVHNYERYERNGVEYITTGGGGATPYEIERKPTDIYHDPGPTYHYTEWAVGKDTLSFTMTKLELEDGKPKWEIKDKFEVKQKDGPKKE